MDLEQSTSLPFFFLLLLPSFDLSRTISFENSILFLIEFPLQFFSLILIFRRLFIIKGFFFSIFLNLKLTKNMLILLLNYFQLLLLLFQLGKLGDFFFPSSSLQEITNVECISLIGSSTMRQSVNNMADITAKKRAKNSFHSSPSVSLPSVRQRRNRGKNRGTTTSSFLNCLPCNVISQL